VTQAVPAAPATNAASSVDPATAANAVQALTPNTRPVINGDTLPSTASQVPTAQPSRPLTPQEQKMFERARQQEADALKVRQKRDAEEAKRQEQINKNAQEAAAKRNAEMAKKQAELAKKQAEEDKKKQKEVTEAEKKLKAAQAAYDAEVAKTKKQQQ
jgi:colicin import membrane protein